MPTVKCVQTAEAETSLKYEDKVKKKLSLTFCLSDSPF